MACDGEVLAEVDAVADNSVTPLPASPALAGEGSRRDIRLSVVRLEGELALAAHLPGVERPAYFILLELEGGRVTAIRDYRHVPYVAAEAQFEEL